MLPSSSSSKSHSSSSSAYSSSECVLGCAATVAAATGRGTFLLNSTSRGVLVEMLCSLAAVSTYDATHACVTCMCTDNNTETCATFMTSDTGWPSTTASPIRTGMSPACSTPSHGAPFLTAVTIATPVSFAWRDGNTRGGDHKQAVVTHRANPETATHVHSETKVFGGKLDGHWCKVAGHLN